MIEIAPKETEIHNISWQEAKMYCFSLGPGWRLPTIQELTEIYNSESDFGDNWYWSSTENFYDKGYTHDHGVWMKAFFNGENDYFESTDSYRTYARAVRDL